MESFQPPQPLSLEGDVAGNWKRWRQMFELYIEATEATEKSAKTKIAMLLSALGPEAVDRFNHYTWKADKDNEKYDKVLEMFEEEFGGEKRTVFNRYKFWDHKRLEMNFDEYLTQLKKSASMCEFEETDNMIRDKIIFDMKEQGLKERLLREKDLSLLKTVTMCRAAEVTQKEVKSMSSAQAETQMHQMTTANNSYKTRRKFKGKSWRHKKENCGRCGTDHGPRLEDHCPAWGQECHACHRKNHFARMCKIKPRTQGINEVTNDSESSDEFFMGSLCIGNIETSPSRSWYEAIDVGGGKVQMKIDTGAEANVLPLKTFKKLPNAELKQVKKSNTILRAYGGSRVQHMGKVDLRCKINNQEQPCEFYITTGKGAPPILGLLSSEALGLVHRGASLENITLSTINENPLEHLKEEFCDVFEGLGKFKGEEPYHIELKPGVTPVIQPPRKVPFALHDKLKETLDQMEKDGVIKKVERATDWVNSMVIVEKKDSTLRVCIDPRHLNEAIKRQHHYIPTYQDVISQLAGKKVFTILDQKNSYWQVELDQQSAELCTFNTPFYRYCFLRLPFGLCSASEVLQKHVYKAFGDIPGVYVIADDMIIATEDDQSHDETLRKVMARAREKGVKFNKNKIQYKVKEVKYMGQILSAEGQRPDEDKIRAIRDMPVPENKTDVQRLMGMLNYLSSYIPNMSTITAPLRHLLKKEAVWAWMPEHDKALETLKDILSSRPLLRFFDPSKKATIQCDASSMGLGACLLQEGHPVAYVSKSLTEAEQNYFQIEKELLAILFSAEKFSQYIYGREVEVESDHKPLEVLFHKPIHMMSPRLQLMMMRLARYKLSVGYVPGSRLYIADTLSRAYLKDKGATILNPQEVEMRIHSMVQELPMSEEKQSEMQQATAADEELQMLKDRTVQGWPQNRSLLPQCLYPYWTVKEEVYEAEGLMFLADKLIVPRTQRLEMLIKLHEGHLGEDKCKIRARESLYWPGITEDIEQFVSRCAICAEFRRNNEREPLHPHEVPAGPRLKNIDLSKFRISVFCLHFDVS